MRTPRFALPAVVLCALALSACSGGGDEPGDAPDPGQPATSTSATSTAVAAPAGDCPTVPQEGYELSSSDVFSEVPASGAVWGDGTLISWTFADGAEHIVGVDMSYVNEAGDAIPMSGIFLDDMGGGTVGSTLLVFDSNTNGRPGFMTLTETEGTDTETLGVYCVTFKVSE
ncbi:MAG: hypothetical protein ABUL56_03390 [Actinomycetota bacterium]